MVLVLGLLVVLAGGALAVVSRVLADLRQLPEHGFGLCSGMPDPALGAVTALTPWLEQELQELAARPADAAPLTFGDLERAGVRLRMMTTDLSTHQPCTMPWDGRRFFFRRETFADLFPPRVVAHLEQSGRALAPRTTDEAVLYAEAERRGLLPWPAASDLPVVVATRMSLSFPGLISAVPLWTVDPLGDKDAGGHAFAPHWFSDGGLCANLPVHFFDAPVPHHPTFAINLVQRSAVQPDQAQNVYLPEGNSAGARRALRNPDRDASPFAALGWFAGSLLTTARDWVDEAQLVMPGYRDRVVRIYHTKEEGGLNLTMPPEKVTELSERGRQAALRLARHFGPAEPGTPSKGLDDHRWVRYRTAMAGFSDWLAGFAEVFEATTGEATAYPELVAERTATPTPPYPPANRRDAAAMAARTEALRVLAASWEGEEPDAFTAGRPRPAAVLRLVPDEAGAHGSGGADGQGRA